jgi:hypothetical protein
MDPVERESGTRRRRPEGLWVARVREARPQAVDAPKASMRWYTVAGFTVTEFAAGVPGVLPASRLPPEVERRSRQGRVRGLVA